MSGAEEPIKCLLVDDLEENLVALEALLQDEGLLLLKARSGEEALELLLVHDIALALLDVQMPGMNGFEVAQFMRGSERSRHVPIIFLTAGSADQQRRFSGYEAGAVDFIQKPIEADILRSKAAVFFDLYRQRRQIGAQRDELEVLARELQASNQRKNEFLAVLGHELRNPLMAFGAGLRLLQRRNDAETAQVVHAQMDRCVHQLTRLIEDLLDIARIDQGKILLRKEPVELQDALNFAVEASRHHIETGQHALRLDLPRDPVRLHADYARLVQIFSNLLSNAAKYTPAGGRIGLALVSTETEAIVAVSDNGPGIPEEMQGKIFDLFAQAPNPAELSDGLGIGLALVRQLTQLHGGSVHLKSSAPGQGSVFEVRLPLATRPAAASDDEEPSA